MAERHDSGRGGVRGYAAEFVRGAVRPSLGGVVGTVLVALGVFAACALWITPELIAGRGYGYFINDEHDFYAHATAHVLRLAADPPREPSVFYMGASATREALSSQEHLQQLLVERTGQRIGVHNVATDGLTHWEAVAIVELLGDEVRGAVVVEVSPKALGRPRTFLESLAVEPRLLVDTPAWDRELREAGLERATGSGNFFIDNYRFFTARPGIVLNFVRGPIEVVDHSAEEYRRLSEAEMQRSIEMASKWMDTYEQRREANMAAYARLAETAGEQLDVVLLEAPRNPRVYEYWRAAPQRAALFEQYQRDVASLAQRIGAAYLNVQAEAQLEDDDFADATHIYRHEARRRYTAALAAKLSPELTPHLAAQLENGS